MGRRGGHISLPTRILGGGLHTMRKRRNLRLYTGVALSTASSLFSHSAHAKMAEGSLKTDKKLSRERAATVSGGGQSINYRASGEGRPPQVSEKYPWKKNIVTTTFWVGEQPTKNNPVP